ncbi:unnamed protein product [Bursaphelenchus okinawaensis]|uniref:Protein asunder n=1 Tax=Bursaphelenchus okinawaensis TaxID=465554 RepID=A0A811L2I5_9BILA|nr:unnamed protein product [Bursaphelenchus okinawaensis]CAG9115408.1 unnamed protein product [Bursaphelenchus okinawaensis]
MTSTVFSELHELPSHKTIIVLDRGPKFAAMCAEVKIPSTNSSLNQSRWSCAIQAVVEFHRVLSDLYPNSTKLLRLVISDTGGRFTTPAWSDVITDYRAVLHSFIGSKPDPQADPASSSINNGLVMCMDALTEPTPLQKMVQKGLNKMKQDGRSFKVNDLPPIKAKRTPNSTRFYDRLQKYRTQQQTKTFTKPKFVRNAGTVIAFTTIESFDEFKKLISNMEDEVLSRNELFKNSCNDPNFISELVMLPISRLNLHIIQLAAANEAPNPTLIAQCQEFATNRLSLVNVKLHYTTGTNLIRTMHSILQYDYGVQSTTVQNIPMKEEANAGKSVNYNVEMFHTNIPQAHLRQYNLIDSESPIVKSDGEYRTTWLKWSSVNNKLNAAEAPIHENGAPVTVAKVRDRPAICICNFILNGKFVLLDMDPESKVSELEANFHGLKISHFFSLDKSTGAMFLNSMRFDVNSLPTLPLPQNHLLLFPMAKYLESISFEIDVIQYPLKMAPPREKLKPTEITNQIATYLPIHDNDTIVFQLPEYFLPIFEVVNYNRLPPQIIANAKSFIYRAVGEKLASIKIPQSSNLPTNLTNEEKVREVFIEIARIMKVYAVLTPEHNEFYNFVLSVTGLDLNEEFSHQKRTESPSLPVKRSDSKSPIPTKKSKKNENDGLTLHEMYLAKSESCWRGWKDFEGRANSKSNVAKLYPGLKLSDIEPLAGVRPSDRRRNVIEQ